MTAVTRDVPVERALSARFAHARAVHVGSRFTLYEALPTTGTAHPSSVIVKVPSPHQPHWVHDMLRAQATLLGRLAQHPHVVKLLDVVTVPDGRPALVLEHCPVALADVVTSRLPLSQVIATGIKLAAGLDAVHSAGYVHCDVRPANALFTGSGEPVLAGFDEAIPLGAATARFPHHVVTAHTAPELLEGADPTPASDVYGLAATLYELVAGQPAFRQYDGESAATVIVRVLSGQVQPIVDADVPLEVSDLLIWAMTADPAKRPPTPAWFAEELGRLESQLGVERTRVLP